MDKRRIVIELTGLDEIPTSWFDMVGAIEGLLAGYFGVPTGNIRITTELLPVLGQGEPQQSINSAQGQWGLGEPHRS